MAEYVVRILRRKMPLVGNKLKVKGLERDQVSVEAPDEDSALKQALKAEYAEGGSRLRAYVEVDASTGGSRGLGDYALMEIREEEDAQKRAKEHGPQAD